MHPKIAFLLVTCSREETRASLIPKLIDNLLQQHPALSNDLYVFDNASTAQWTVDLLKNNFKNVFQSNINVGYWTAIYWWLQWIKNNDNNYDYVYIIESDFLHYDFSKLDDCAKFLDLHNDVGSIRLHEYSVENKHLYNKDTPHKDSKRNVWRTHTNLVTGKKIEFVKCDNNLWITTFLTHLPAINRYNTLIEIFDILNNMPNFTEFDFQKLYWNQYQKTGVYNGGIYTELSTGITDSYNLRTISGSHPDVALFNKIGYYQTRTSKIIKETEFFVK